MPDDEALLDELSRMNNELVDLQRALAKRNRELEEALARVKLLSGLLPICVHCKKIRDDQGYWRRVEEYVQAHSEAEFTHSLCPACLEVHYPDEG